MNIFSAKYKAHRLVNYIFYILVFVSGFLVGLGIKNFDVKSFVRKLNPFVLFIGDEVEAFSIAGTNYSFDYDFIIESFERNSDYNFEDYPNIICGLWVLDNGQDQLDCFAFQNNFTSITFSTISSNSYRLVHMEGTRFMFYYNITNSVFDVEPELRTTNYNNVRIFNKNSSNYISHANFQFPVDSVGTSLDYQPIYDLYPSDLEAVIYNRFLEAFPNFSLLDNSHIYCSLPDIRSNIGCRALSDNVYNNLTSGSSYASWASSIDLVPPADNSSYSITLYKNFTLSSYNISTNTDYYLLSWGSRDRLWTNFDLTSIIDNSSALSGSQKTAKKNSLNSSLNSTYFTLNFNPLILNFNADLFENDSNFKKVCLNEGDSFTITPSQGFYSNTGFYEDFIWFPYGLNGGLFKILYDNGSEYSNGNIVLYPEESMSEHFYFSSFLEINSFYDTDLPSDFEQAGYTNKYSYFGYDAYKFFILYNNGTYRYPIFIWDNPSKTTISSSGIIHGGSGRRLDFDEDLDISTDYCFYIKNQYDVTIVQANEWGDFYGTVSSPDGDYNFSTTYNIENYQISKGYFSIVNDFISQIRSTINFINTQIYNFYLSMPLIVRTFILSVLTLFIVKLIINMIVR